MPLHPAPIRMNKFYLYETASFFYLIGCDVLEKFYRVIKFDRQISKPTCLSDIMMEDIMVYNKEEIAEMLKMIDEGNKSSGGIVQVVVACGIIGFTKFLDCYYITLITQRKKVGQIGPNTIYAIRAAEVFPIRPRDQFTQELSLRRIWHHVNKRLNQTSTEIAESRYMGLFQFIDLTKDFFFSYTYDLTNSLQYNFLMSDAKRNSFPPPPTQEMYEWNRFQTEEFRGILGDSTAAFWILPIIHGSYQQRRYSLFGAYVDLTLIARRSRHYAGTRYLKRGISSHGKVANDCETEQILQTYHGTKPNFSSYIQIRGSVPTFWSQETSVTMPVPPVIVNRFDPCYLATQEHFADLFRRYSAPVIVLDLLKLHEHNKRETILGEEFRYAISILNGSMDRDEESRKRKIRYCALDFSGMSKTKGSAVASSSGPLTAAQSSDVDSSHGQSSSSASGLNDMDDSYKASGRTDFIRLESVRGGDPHDRGAVLGFRKNSRLIAQKHLSKGIPPPPSQMTSTSTLSSSPSTPGSIGGPTSANHKGAMTSSAPEMTGGADVLHELEDISDWSLSETAYFCSSVDYLERVASLPEKMKVSATTRGYLEQRGVLRTNCLDCLDRTNTAQFAAGLRFLSLGLRALGILGTHSDSPSNAMILGLLDMYSDMGDRLALQYGGSEAHKKVAAAPGAISNSSKHGELLTSIKRYYSNAFTDRVKQDAMNLFLGYYVPCSSEYALWDLESDFHLHNKFLRPPQPRLDAVLYGFHRRKNRRIKNSHSEDEMNTVSMEDSSEFSDNEFSEKFQAIHYEDLMQKYFIIDETKSFEETEIRESIATSEERKYRVRKRCDRLLEAMEYWWVSALDDFELRQHWMSLPIPESLAGSMPTRFDYIHPPRALSFFDNEMTVDYLNPIDASELSAFEKPNAFGYWNRKPAAIQTQTSMNLGPSLTTPPPLSSPSSSTKLSHDADNLDLSIHKKEPIVVVSNSSSAAAPIRNQVSSPPSKTVDKISFSATNSFALPVKRAVHHDNDSTTSLEGEDLIRAHEVFFVGTDHHISESNNPSIGASNSKEEDVDSSISAFGLGNYVRQIGLKARSLVMGGLLRLDQYATQEHPVEKTLIDESSWSSANLTLADANVFSEKYGTDKISCSLYEDYVKNAYEPERMIDIHHDSYNYVTASDINNSTNNNNNNNNNNNQETARLGFEKNLSEILIAADDVGGMQRLSSDAYINSVIGKGQYQGMYQDDSATLAFGIVSTASLFAEQYVDQSYNNYKTNNISKVVDFSIPKTAKNSLTRSINGITDGVSAVLESEAVEQLNKYISKQKQFSHHIDENILSQRLSDLTNEQIVLDYAKLLDRDVVARDLYNIKFVASDGENKLSSDLASMGGSLYISYQEFEEAKEKYLNDLRTGAAITIKSEDKNSSNLKEDTTNTSGIIPTPTDVKEGYEMKDLSADSVYKLNEISRHKIKNKMSSSARSQINYSGFVQIGQDLFCKSSNHLLQMNETAVIAYVNALPLTSE